MAASRPLTWLITGCSSGFGYELAQELLKRDEKVIATARNGPARLKSLKEQGAAVLDLDVTWSQSKIDETVQEALKVYEGGIDVLVNNAGYVGIGILEELPLEDIQASLDCMTFGAVRMMRAVLPHFREKQAGYNVVISSIYGWAGGPASSPYAAAKFALEGIIECAEYELKPFNVTNLILEPGWYRTNMASPSNARLARGSIAAYDKQRSEANAGVQGVNGNQPGDPRKAVKLIVDIVRREGAATGKSELPLRIPMGPDGFQTIKQKCLDTLKIIEEWESITKETNLD